MNTKHATQRAYEVLEYVGLKDQEVQEDRDLQHWNAPSNKAGMRTSS